MIIVYHNTKRVLFIEGVENLKLDSIKNIGSTLFKLAQKFPDEILVWCDIQLEQYLNKENIENFFHHNKMMVSFNPHSSTAINNRLGYVDHGSSLLINKAVSFCSWQMSATVGAVHATVLNAISNQVTNKKENFEYLLNSIAKLALMLGLFCYSEPLLLKQKKQLKKTNETNNYTLFKFVKQHYHIKWMPILFMNFLLFEKKIMLFPLLYSLFYKKRNWDKNILDTIEVKSNKRVAVTNEIDVIIPTIGRKKYLYNVLQDLRNQTYLPKNVIIVEQNPVEGSVTELDFISVEQWPFQINHVFTHQAGVCNARNIALSKVSSEWVFWADDDICIENNFLSKGINYCVDFGIETSVFNCLLVGEKHNYNKVHQTIIFGSGCSFVKSNHLKQVAFNSKYEFGYGEDFDFGMQLRNIGVDVIYLPEPSILHLKAPMGGFRIKPSFQWDSEAIVPRPSPTVMLNNLKYRTQYQLLGYKTLYFYKLYTHNWFQNPIVFFKKTNAHWAASIRWANKLRDND